MENKSQILIYQTENGETKLDVRFHEETVWLSQKMMAQLFQTTVPNINMHLKNIFDEGELEENRTIQEFLIVQQEGNRDVQRKQIFYNMDRFLSLNDREILSGAGSISHELAKANAEREFDTFNEIRRNLIDKSDFDDVLKNIENKKDK
jgi:hypothetical protein